LWRSARCTGAHVAARARARAHTHTHTRTDRACLLLLEPLRFKIALACLSLFLVHDLAAR
jgi:hypothetical protein